MSSRGEENFVNLPGFGARLYDNLTQTRAIQAQFGEIAQDLVSRIDRGRLLDVGTGPGRLLLEIHKLNPDIDLFGLDIAASMIQVAMKNLSGIRVDLRQATFDRPTTRAISSILSPAPVAFTCGTIQRNASKRSFAF